MDEGRISRGAQYRVVEPGIVHGWEESDATFELADAVEAMELIRKLASGRRVGLLMDISKLRSMAREARAYFMRKEQDDVLLAVALLTNSLLSRAIGNIFLGLNRPPTPVRLFTEYEAALAWLRTYLPDRAPPPGAAP